MRAPEKIIEIAERSAQRQFNVYDIQDLRRAFEKLGSASALFHDLVPIRLATIIEHSVRGAIQEAVDEREVYAERAISAISKLSGKSLAEIIKVISSGKITIGHIAAHVCSVGSVTDIVSGLNAIFCRDIKVALSVSATRWTEEDRNEPGTIIDNVNTTFEIMDRLLSVRHILVHERPRRPVYESGEILIFIDHAHKFVSALDWFVVGDLYGTIPYTQAQMNMDASAKANASREHLNHIRGGDSENFKNPATKKDEIEYHWDMFCDLSAQNYAGYLDDGHVGTISPLLYANAFQFMTEWRLDQFKKFGRLWDPQGD